MIHSDGLGIACGHGATMHHGLVPDAARAGHDSGMFVAALAAQSLIGNWKT
jgi:hypothetical protein